MPEDDVRRRSALVHPAQPPSADGLGPTFLPSPAPVPLTYSFLVRWARLNDFPPVDTFHGRVVVGFMLSDDSGPRSVVVGPVEHHDHSALQNDRRVFKKIAYKQSFLDSASDRERSKLPCQRSP